MEMDFGRTKYAPKSRYAMQNRWWAFLEPTINFNW